MVLAVGVTANGQKIILGMVQTATENRPVCSAFLQSLLDRGLRIEAGLLVVIDGAKGLRAAVQAVFGVPAETLLPVISAEVERKIISRAHLLSRRHERHSDSARTKRKIRFLTSVCVFR